MSSADPSPSTDQRPELVFALVGGAGTRLKVLAGELKKALATFEYRTEDIGLSDLLENFTGWTTEPTGMSEFDRIRHRQDMGNAFRKRLNKGDALARAGIAQIRTRRTEIAGRPDRPAPACAYIMHQLKHPDEVDLLRQVYGSSFFLIAGHAPRKQRVEELVRRMVRKEALREDSHLESKAFEVITIDEKQDDDIFGQNTRDTYPKADFFANSEVSLEYEVHRFVDLLFGHPFHTPQPDEYAMYQASAVSLRSSDDNRQVGAVIVNQSHDQQGYIKIADVIAVGMNEVPRGGGGFYWGKFTPDCRDQKLLEGGEDRAAEIKISALTELIKKIIQKRWLKKRVSIQDAHALARDLLKDLRGTQFLDIGEFSRPVHAEMAALIDAARRGVSVDGHSMYVTTFPCHNCAKHIIAAGIRRVVYLEPYPKSRAQGLYREEITLDEKEEVGKVAFFAFTGIAPRQYRLLFSMSERGAKKGKSLIDWNANRRSLAPQCVPQNASLRYLKAECQELRRLPRAIYNIP
jgi:deoxycytidylate deaminase